MAAQVPVLQPVVLLPGPTASGKTALSIALCQVLRCRLISVDSSLVYRGMDIGTAKPSPTEQQRAPHHLIDIRDPFEPYSVAEFLGDAHAEIEAAAGQQQLPLLSGGTMMYFNALLNGLAPMPPADANVRARLDRQEAEHGLAWLHARLTERDPAAAERIHPNDPQRIKRALEVELVSGRPISAWQSQQTDTLTTRGCRFLLLGLYPEDRAALHQRIAARFDAMLADGFVDEVRALTSKPDFDAALPSMRSVGYRQALAYLDGQLDHAAFRERAIAATRQLAKRQLTWMRSMPGLIRLDSLALDNDILCGTALSHITAFLGQEHPYARR